MIDTAAIFVDVLQDLVRIIAFAACAFAAYLTLQQPPLQAWLAESRALVRVVAFIIITQLLAFAANAAIANLFVSPRGFSTVTSGLVSSVQCLTGLVMLACLVGGAWLIAKRAPAK